MGEVSILLLGFGNPGRGDDGLGPALADEVERLGLPGVTVDADYQLTFEHAAGVGEHDVTVFVDAGATTVEPFSFDRIDPDPDLPWSSHGLEPPALVAFANGIYSRENECYILAIRGYAFEEFTEELSERARENLHESLAFVVPVLRQLSSRETAFTAYEDRR